MMLIQWYRPYESRFANWIETFNECSFLMLVYLVICFTDFVPDPRVRSNLGLLFIGQNCGMMLVHIVIIVSQSLHALKITVKKRCNKLKRAKQAK